MHFLAFFVGLAWITFVVHCTPVPFIPTYPPASSLAANIQNPLDVKRYMNDLEEAFERVEQQIKKMKDTIHCAANTKCTDHTNSLTNVHAVFTDKCNLATLSKMIDKMADPTATLPIIQIIVKTHFIAYVVLVTGREKKGLYIGSQFYKRPLWDQVLTLVHEASHYFLSTADYWEYNIEKTKVFPVQTRVSKDAFNGGWEHNFNTVKDKSPEVLHLNADTWGLFGFYLTYKRFPEILHSTHPSQSLSRTPSVEKLRPKGDPVIPPKPTRPKVFRS